MSSQESYVYQNPVIPGFNPDPSICRTEKGNDFYLVCSSFEFFPGVPLYRSENLVNWRLSGHCLNRESQLPLERTHPSGGIYAPTIRWHEGVFYMTTTNVSHGRNFIVHTTDPELGWSEPVPVSQSGIDPSLFFDDDGTVYYTSTGWDENGQGIQMSVVDPMTGEILQQPKIITHGAGGAYPEGPHLYKRNGWYYLMLAEGGTEYGHHVTIHRSRSPWGPYETSPYGQVLGNQGNHAIPGIGAVGHADLVEDGNGNWWAVCHAVRMLPGLLLHNLGRETYLVPVTWREDGWPVFAGDGYARNEMCGPLPAQPQNLCFDFHDSFDEETLKPQWTFLENPPRGICTVAPEKREMVLKGTTGLSDRSQPPAYVGVRQFSNNICATVKLNRCTETGGLTVFYGVQHHYEIYLRKTAEECFVCVNKRIYDLEAEVVRIPVSADGEVEFRVTCEGKIYRFYYRTPEMKTFAFAASGTAAALCTEITSSMTFTGTFIGLFSTGGESGFCDFDLSELKAENLDG